MSDEDNQNTATDTDHEANGDTAAGEEPKIAYFATDVAEELLDLVADRPGEADEDLLDSAITAIENASAGLDADAQQAVARGDGVAVGLDGTEAQSLTTLIETNTETDKSVLGGVSRTLKSKLRAAGKKAKKNN